jgi:NAD(P)-dependent dehydrogenase (short-subunit alcohol dehydrogenase family)
MSALDEAVVAIAGAGGGAGPALATRLAAAGATVVLVDAVAERAQAVAEQVRLAGGRAEAGVVDLLDDAATRAWADGLLARHGRVDGLMHLVGGWQGGTPLTDPVVLEQWDSLEGPLVRTVQRTAAAFRDALAASPSGRFVLVSSREATAPTQTNAAYAAAKAAAEAWTLALAHSFTGTPAAATVVVVKALLTPAMREAKPDAAFAGYTPVAELAETVTGLWDVPAAQVNGTRVWLTDVPATSSP